MRSSDPGKDGVLKILLSDTSLICPLPRPRQVIGRLEPISVAELQTLLNSALFSRV